MRKAMHNQEPLENQTHDELSKESAQTTTADEFLIDALQTDENQDLAATMQAELQTVQKDYDELKDKYMRIFAEFDNYKRRAVKERYDLIKTASQDIVTALLPVLDDFDRAKRNDEVSEGINLIYNKLHAILQSKGLETMESNGQLFNPEFHEALTEITAPNEELKGKVVDTIEKGYQLGDKIIRYAKVVVGK